MINMMKLTILDWGNKSKRNMITMEEFDKLREEVSKITFHKLQKGDKPYMARDIIYPRTYLTKLYGCKSTTLANCDTIIIDKEEEFDMRLNWMLAKDYERDPSDSTWTIYDHIGFTDYYECKGFWTDDDSHKARIKGGRILKLLDGDGESYITKLIKLLELSKTKKIVDSSTLELNNSNLYLDDSAFTKINQMMQSNDEEMHKMGITLTMAFNYQKSKHRMAALLMSGELYCGKKTIEIKTIIDRIENEFGEESFDFWFKILCEKEDDILLQDKFNSYITNYQGIELPCKIKITKY